MFRMKWPSYMENDIVYKWLGMLMLHYAQVQGMFQSSCTEYGKGYCSEVSSKQ